MVCGLSRAGIAGSKTAGDIDVCDLCELLGRGSATGRSLVQRSLTACCVFVIQKPQGWDGPGPRSAVAPEEKQSYRYRFISCPYHYVLFVFDQRLATCILIRLNSHCVSPNPHPPTRPRILETETQSPRLATNRRTTFHSTLTFKLHTMLKHHSHWREHSGSVIIYFAEFLQVGTGKVKPYSCPTCHYKRCASHKQLQ